MDGDPPQSDLSQRPVVLLVHWDLLQVIQRLPAINHPVREKRRHFIIAIITDDSDYSGAPLIRTPCSY